MTEQVGGVVGTTARTATCSSICSSHCSRNRINVGSLLHSVCVCLRWSTVCSFLCRPSVMDTSAKSALINNSWTLLLVTVKHIHVSNQPYRRQTCLPNNKLQLMQMVCLQLARQSLHATWCAVASVVFAGIPNAGCDATSANTRSFLILIGCFYAASF